MAMGALMLLDCCVKGPAVPIMRPTKCCQTETLSWQVAAALAADVKVDYETGEVTTKTGKKLRKAVRPRCCVENTGGGSFTVAACNTFLLPAAVLLCCCAAAGVRKYHPEQQADAT